LTRPWLLLVAACAIVVLAVGLAVSSAQRPPSRGLAAGPCSAREPSTVDAATDAAAAKADAAGNAEVAAGSAHQHGVDPVSAALLAIDGVVALAVVVLLLRRPPPQPPRPPS
jgi:hypothetical protein